MSVAFRTPFASGTSSAANTQAATGSVTVGDGLVVWVANSGSGNAAPTGVSDNAGNSYAAAGTAVYIAADDTTISQFYCKSASSTASVTVTATWAANQANRGIYVLPCFGHDATATPAAVIGSVQTTTATTDAMTTGNITPSAQPGTFIGFTANTFGNTQNAGTGFTDQGSSFTNWLGTLSIAARAESLAYSSLSAAAMTFTSTVASGRNVSAGMAIPNAGGGARPRPSSFFRYLLSAGVFCAAASVGGLSIIVSWSAPLTLADGSAVSGVTGYTVYWDTVSRVLGSVADYANSHFVSGAGTLTYTISSLASGTYYVAVTTTGAGGEGEPDYERTISI